MEGGMRYMNLGVDSWRNWLKERIAQVVERFNVDAYFLDIAGGWENNTQADMHEGSRRVVEELRRKYPQVLACGEMHYDALMAFIPVYQVFSDRGFPQPFLKSALAFQHLSRPQRGRGAIGGHDSCCTRPGPEAREPTD